jgi:hypothetical protein
MLASIMATKKQANDGIHENLLRNFLFNTPTGTFGLSLSENDTIDGSYRRRHPARFPEAY